MQAVAIEGIPRVNPFRLEGQKTIVLEMLQQLKTRGHLLATLGTTNPLVAAPAIAAAKLIAKGQVKRGVMAVEALDPAAYLKEVAAIMPLDIVGEVAAVLRRAAKGKGTLTKNRGGRRLERMT